MTYAMPGPVLVALLALGLGGCTATKAAPSGKASIEPAKPVFVTPFEPKNWPLRLTRL
jgi:hypothetical protein